MKAKPMRAISGGYEPCEPSEATHLRMEVPGPFSTRILPVMIGGTRAGTRNWTWNGSIESPTVKPSIRTTDGVEVCHSFINDGKIQFLGDCTHAFAGQTMDLFEVD